ncbi:MAG: type II toxin-antitoxin system RelE/ParE family toxin [Nitrospirota bacterium]
MGCFETSGALSVILPPPPLRCCEEDIPDIPRNFRHRIANAIESRLTLQAHQYGAPLRKTLKEYWKLRVGDYRIVYKLDGDEILVLGIRYRETVYEDLL